MIAQRPLSDASVDSSIEDARHPLNRCRLPVLIVEGIDIQLQHLNERQEPSVQSPGVGRRSRRKSSRLAVERQSLEECSPDANSARSPHRDFQYDQSATRQLQALHTQKGRLREKNGTRRRSD